MRRAFVQEWGWEVRGSKRWVCLARFREPSGTVVCMLGTREPWWRLVSSSGVRRKWFSKCLGTGAAKAGRSEVDHFLWKEDGSPRHRSSGSTGGPLLSPSPVVHW